MIRAIVFDFDGLIFDTETPSYEAIKEVYSQYGAEMTLQFWGTVVGTHGIDIYAPIAEQTGQAIDREAARQHYNRAHQARLQEGGLRPGVLDYLQRGRALGLKIGLASSSDRTWIDSHLARFGIAEYFDCTFTSSEVERVKPAPDLYLAALAALGVEPQEAIAFEDSPNGSLAAKRAGMKVVAFPNEITRLLTFGELDLRYPSMAEVTLDDLIATLS